MQVIVTIPAHVVQAVNDVKGKDNLSEEAEVFEVLDWLTFDSEDTSHEMYHLAEEISRQIPIITIPDTMTVFLRRTDNQEIIQFQLIQPIRTMSPVALAEKISTATGLNFEFVRIEENN